MTTVVATQQELHHTGPIVADHVGVATVGTHVTRYGLALVLVWIGAMKFTTYEAEAIHGLVTPRQVTPNIVAVADDLEPALLKSLDLVSQLSTPPPTRFGPRSDSF